MQKIVLMSVGLAALNLLALCHARTPDEQQPRSPFASFGWDPLQGRRAFASRALSLRVDPPSREFGDTRLSSVTLIGSHYLAPSLSQLSFSGLRATSGMKFGQRSPLWATPGSFASPSLYPERRRGPFPDMLTDPLANGSTGNGNASYVGIGYTGLSLKGTWGFSADLGLVSLNPGSIVRLGRVFNGSQTLDDMVRDLRFTPVLQLGISYTF